VCLYLHFVKNTTISLLPHRLFKSKFTPIKSKRAVQTTFCVSFRCVGMWANFQAKWLPGDAPAALQIICLSSLESGEQASAKLLLSFIGRRLRDKKKNKSRFLFRLSISKSALIDASPLANWPDLNGTKKFQLSSALSVCRAARKRERDSGLIWPTRANYPSGRRRLKGAEGAAGCPSEWR
jgi:hypothetical protein